MFTHDILIIASHDLSWLKAMLGFGSLSATGWVLVTKSETQKAVNVVLPRCAIFLVVHVSNLTPWSLI